MVSSRLSPLDADEAGTSSVTTSADSRLAAISKVVRVRVEASKNSSTTVLPRSSGTFLTLRAPTSTSESASVNSSSRVSRRRPSSVSR